MGLIFLFFVVWSFFFFNQNLFIIFVRTHEGEIEFANAKNKEMHKHKQTGRSVPSVLICYAWKEEAGAGP